MNLKLTLSTKKAITGYLFILPFVIGFCYIILFSIYNTIQMSFSTIVLSAAGVGVDLIWNDFQNYIHAFAVHPTFNQVLIESLLSLLIDLPLIIFFSLFMAMFLNQKFKGRTFVRIIFFLPVIIAAPAISGALSTARAMMVGGISPASAELMEYIGGGTMVDVSYYLMMLGQYAIPPEIIIYLVGAVGRINTIIINSGVQIIIFLAALQSIPPSIYEAAKIEGASTYETFWKITLPMVSPLILTNVVYTIVDSFTRSPVVQLSYSTIFSDFNYGLGTVFALVSSVSVCLMLVLIWLILRRSIFYHN